ncbi:hypothetical protein [Endozoicomonas sp. Mp262]|uniref:hypothetical protein n=1 Tax=Endozoicomonas sp. Mp262 TaxID=2919499 RepID=UPI0021DA0890
MIRTVVSGLASVVLLGAVSGVSASEDKTQPVFGEAQVLLEGENVRQFDLKDLNGDYRVDLIWLEGAGDVKYRLQENRVLQNFEDLEGTRWKMVYTNNNRYKWVTFNTTEGGKGIIETENNDLYNIVNHDVTENGEHTFCTYGFSGLHRTECRIKYTIHTITNNTMTGTDLSNNEPWTASKILN